MQHGPPRTGRFGARLICCVLQDPVPHDLAAPLSCSYALVLVQAPVLLPPQLVCPAGTRIVTESECTATAELVLHRRLPLQLVPEHGTPFGCSVCIKNCSHAHLTLNVNAASKATSKRHSLVCRNVSENWLGQTASRSKRAEAWQRAVVQPGSAVTAEALHTLGLSAVQITATFLFTVEQTLPLYVTEMRESGLPYDGSKSRDEQHCFVGKRPFRTGAAELPGRCLVVDTSIRNDGFGSQLWAIISGLAFCRRCGCMLSRSSIAAIDMHGEAGAQQRPTNLDDLVPEANGLIDAMVQHAADISNGTLRLWRPSIMPYVHQKVLPCLRVMSLHGEMQSQIEEFFSPAICAWLRAAWLTAWAHRTAARPERSQLGSPSQGSHPALAAVRDVTPNGTASRPSIAPRSLTVIAMHVRRYDILNTSQKRWVSDARSLLCLRHVLSRHPGASAHVHTWKTPLPSFAEYAVVHAGEANETFETFQAFVDSDVFILGKSTLSYAAALLHDGPVYAMPEAWHSTTWFFHLRTWLNC